MIKFLQILILFIFISSLNIYPAYAQVNLTPSPEATSEASASGVNSKLEGLRRDIASKAAVIKAEIDKKIGNKAYVGKMAGLSIDTITIDAKSGSKSVKVDEYTVFQDQSSTKTKKALTIDTLKSDDYLIALGEVDEKLLMTAKKIIKVDPPKSSGFSYVMGQITKVEPRKLTLKSKSGVEQIIDFGTTTPIKNDKNDGTIEDLKLTRNAIVVLPSKEATQSAYIYVLPFGGLKKATEASATASPSASAKPKK